MHYLWNFALFTLVVYVLVGILGHELTVLVLCGVFFVLVGYAFVRAATRRRKPRNRYRDLTY